MTDPDLVIDHARRLGGGPIGMARAMLSARVAQGEGGIAPAILYETPEGGAVCLIPATESQEEFNLLVGLALLPILEAPVHAATLIADTSTDTGDCVMAMRWTARGYEGTRYPYRIVDQTITWDEPVTQSEAVGPIDKLFREAFRRQRSGAELEVVVAALQINGFEAEVLP